MDSYAVQHPGRPERRAIQSVALHLIGLCLVLERAVEPREATLLLSRIVPGLPELAWLEPPRPNGTLTIQDVLDAPDHMPGVRRWGSAVWTAWEPHHGPVGRWLARALGKRRAE